MKRPEDICQAEYAIFRRQVQGIRKMARETQRRPSEVIRDLIDRGLSSSAQTMGGARD